MKGEVHEGTNAHHRAEVSLAAEMIRAQRSRKAACKALTAGSSCRYVRAGALHSPRSKTGDLPGRGEARRGAGSIACAGARCNRAVGQRQRGCARPPGEAGFDLGHEGLAQTLAWYLANEPWWRPLLNR
ncbi:hypothetical protein [Altererythrobacter sp. TH136]|uniref:hypothetical protein n=1 Tax=Altererythrobacter sp. TH136 TaxID=2067415 RepID=UPI00116331A1|nr:hypothetical protein [Altererythrobacter sp. TH136]QDM41033.1 hypothetical protein C0V74_08325 [Altererythrobacter sp. TH136]